MKRLLQPLLLSTATGLLVALADPGYGLQALIWIAFLPLLRCLEPLSPKERCIWGWWSGFVCYLLILPWLLALWDWASGFILIGYVFLSAMLALLWAGWAWCCGWLLKKPSILPLLGAPSLWVVLEFARSSGPFGFSWGVVGYDLHPYVDLAQLASWTGVLGLSCVAMLANVGLYLNWKRKKARFALAAGLTVLAVFVMGSWSRTEVQFRMRQAQHLEIALVQPNIPQREKGDPSNLDTLFARYESLLASILGPVDLLILPESILPTLVLDDGDIREKLLAYATNLQAAMLLGTFTRQEQDLFNSAALVSPQGEVLGTYDKVRLVPFSTESFPFIDWLNELGLQRWIGPLSLGALTPGAGFTPVSLEKAVLGTPICFESTFPGITRSFARQGAQVLVTITNDAWFKESIELAQHFAMGILRAVETGRAFVQVANTGLTGVALPDGTVLLQAAPHQALTVRASVPLMERNTPYVIYGDWFVGMVFLVLLVVTTRGALAKGQSSHPSI